MYLAGGALPALPPLLLPSGPLQIVNLWPGHVVEKVKVWELWVQTSLEGERQKKVFGPLGTQQDKPVVTLRKRPRERQWSAPPPLCHMSRCVLGKPSTPGFTEGVRLYLSSCFLVYEVRKWQETEASDLTSFFPKILGLWWIHN